MNDHDHFGRIAHILTTARRGVLEALDECGPSTVDTIAECWMLREPGMRPLVSQALPGMVSQTIWKLHNLGLVDREPGGLWSMTSAGREALADG